MIVTGRMFRSVRAYLDELGLDEPVVCYQGAVVADRVGPVPPPRADPARARARGDRRRRRPRASRSTATSTTSCTSREVTAEARAYADFQHLPIHAVGDLLAWLDEPPTKLVVVGEPGRAGRARARLRAASASASTSRSRCRTSSSSRHPRSRRDGLRLRRRAPRLPLDATVGVRRRRERRRAARVGRLRASRSRTRTSACSAVADFVCPPRGGGRRRAGDRGLPRLTRMIDIRAARSDPDAFRAALARKGAGEAFDELHRRRRALARARAARRRAARARRS